MAFEDVSDLIDFPVASFTVGGNGQVGAAWLDFDNDGWLDIFLTGEGGYLGNCPRPVILYHNNGDGTFTDATAESNIVGPSTSFSAAMADIDNDGLVDLFITGSGSQNGVGPPNSLYINRGNLIFRETLVSGVNTDRGACAAFFTDVNDDGFIDLHVANCVPFFPASPNELFINNGDSTFTEVGATAQLGDEGY